MTKPLSALARREEDQDCIICLLDYAPTDKVIEFNCKHYFHEKCIQEWVKTSGNNQCPVCREPIDRNIIERIPRDRV